jgi:hypothetical protein
VSGQVLERGQEQLVGGAHCQALLDDLSRALGVGEALGQQHRLGP